VTRNAFFDDPLFEEFAVRALSLDGCPLGEIFATTSLIEEGDRDGWYRRWTATAERLAGYADEGARAGHTISATDAYLRASSYYRAAYLPLYGSPVDPRLVEAFDKETEAFQKAAALMTPPVIPLDGELLTLMSKLWGSELAFSEVPGWQGGGWSVRRQRIP
jgi:hypothetical protein